MYNLEQIETEKVEMCRAVLNAHPFKTLYAKLKVIRRQ
jgi:hypothetical protein